MAGNPLPSEVLEAALDRMPVARLALRDLEDAPEALPIVFARAVGALWSPVDGKPKGRAGDLGRIARLKRSPEVMLLLDHYSDDWRDLWWLRLRVTAQVVTGRDAAWAPVEQALASKYPQYRTVPMFKDEPTLLRFAWHDVGWWGSEGLASLERWLSRAP
jgi:PPOX class probable F420-dependent enzyme